MKYLLVLLFVLLPAAAGSACDKCCEEPNIPPALHCFKPMQADSKSSLDEKKRPTAKQLAELNRIYKTKARKDFTMEMWDLEMDVLHHFGYYVCVQCNLVVGPGIDHNFRHFPMKIMPPSAEEMSQMMDNSGW